MYGAVRGCLFVMLKILHVYVLLRWTKIKRDLIQRLNSDQIIGFQNRVTRIEGLSLGSTIDADGETSVLTEGGGEWDME